MNPRVRLVAVILVASATGCAESHGHGGQLAAEHPPGKAPAFGRTRAEAVYVLFARQPPPADLGARRARVGWRLGEWRLGKGEPLGFRASGREVVAVAGRDETRLPAGHYCWHTRPGSEPVDWVKTAVAAGVVGLLVGLAVYLVASYDVPFSYSAIP